MSTRSNSGWVLDDGTYLEHITGNVWIDRSTGTNYILDNEGNVLKKMGVGIAYELNLPRIDLANELFTHGSGLFDTWTGLATQEPPKDLIGRIMWTVGVFAQLIVSTATFPAAIGAFLLEEAVQAHGMSLYMLSTARLWDEVADMSVSYTNFIDGAETGAKTLAALNPMAGGAVLMYMEAARVQAAAFARSAEYQIFLAAGRDEAARQKVLDQAQYGEIRLSSTPSNAEIWLDGVNTVKLTPETFKRLPLGRHTFELRKYNLKTEEWDILVFEIESQANWRKEIHVRIPKGILGQTEDDTDTDEVKEIIVPTWIKAEVEGDYAADGDTFLTTTGERIRILGIDSPELGQAWADVSKDNLQNMIEDKSIQLRIYSAKPVDVYGRTLAICNNYKGNLAIFQLTSGLAKVDIWDDSPLDRIRYDAAEDQAKARKVGIWSGLIE